MNYNKFIVLYMITKNGNQIVKIVDLGKGTKAINPVITTNTYAFKIFMSQLSLDEVIKNFFESEENYNSVFNVFGKELSINDFKKRYPKYKISKTYIDNPSSFVVIAANTFKLSKEIFIFKSKFAHYRVLSKKDFKTKFNLKVITPEELANDYLVKSLF